MGLVGTTISVSPPTLEGLLCPETATFPVVLVTAIELGSESKSAEHPFPVDLLTSIVPEKQYQRLCIRNDLVDTILTD